MRMPEPGPFGETFFEASVRAMLAASLLNKPAGGWVESVLTPALHFRVVATKLSSLLFRCRKKAQALQVVGLGIPGWVASFNGPRI
jgi:hypothetical protein